MKSCKASNNCHNNYGDVNKPNVKELRLQISRQYSKSKMNVETVNSSEKPMQPFDSGIENEDSTEDDNSICKNVKIQRVPKRRLNYESLKTKKNVPTINVIPYETEHKNIPKAIVDLKGMTDELKQLEDPPLTLLEKKLTERRLPFSFFDSPAEELAKNLLGKILVRKLENGTILKGKIVETESYLGGIDKASHTYKLRVTPRNIPMYMPPGTIYVYMTYGMYHCFNLSSQGEGCAVLLRAVEPMEGIECITDHRTSRQTSKVPKKPMKNFKLHELCNGPSKFCIGFQLDKSHNKYSICSWKSMWIESCEIEEEIKIVECPRIGIDSAGEEWANKPLRYYIFGHKSVSKRDKKAEIKFTS